MAQRKKKNKMKPFHIYLDSELLSWLEAESERLDVSKAEITRLALYRLKARGN